MRRQQLRLNRFKIPVDNADWCKTAETLNFHSRKLLLFWRRKLAWLRHSYLHFGGRGIDLMLFKSESAARALRSRTASAAHRRAATALCWEQTCAQYQLICASHLDNQPAAQFDEHNPVRKHGRADNIRLPMQTYRRGSVLLLIHSLPFQSTFSPLSLSLPLQNSYNIKHY